MTAQELDSIRRSSVWDVGIFEIGMMGLIGNNPGVSTGSRDGALQNNVRSFYARLGAAPRLSRRSRLGAYASLGVNTGGAQQTYVGLAVRYSVNYPDKDVLANFDIGGNVTQISRQAYGGVKLETSVVFHKFIGINLSTHFQNTNNGLDTSYAAGLFIAGKTGAISTSALAVIASIAAMIVAKSR